MFAVDQYCRFYQDGSCNCNEPFKPQSCDKWNKKVNPVVDKSGDMLALASSVGVYRGQIKKSK